MPMVLAVLLSASVAAVPDSPELFPLAGDPALVALVDEALEKNPELRAASELAAAASERVPQASAPADPVFAVGYSYGGRSFRPGTDEDTGWRLAFSQELPFSKKRSLAGQVESGEAERAGHVATRARLALVLGLRRAYSELLLARENLALVEDQRRATRDIEELSRQRYAVGLAGQADVLRAQAELARLDQLRLHEEGLEEAALAALNRLLARPAGTPLPTRTPLRAVAEMPLRVPSLEEVVGRVERSPDLAASLAAVERSRAALDLARRGSKPDFVVGASYLNRGPMPDMWTVDLGIVTPLHKGRKQARAVAEAEARLRADQAAREAVRLDARAALERALADYASAVREAQAYAKGVLVVDALAVESAIAAFQSGKSPFLAVLEAHNALYRDRWQHAALLSEVLSRAASLDALGVSGE